MRDDAALRVRYENPPTFLNLAVLVTATHTKYDDALLALSRALVFFQFRNVFTHENVDPQSLTDGAPVNDLDRLVEFKLIFNLWSPTLEEVNDMWGMLGGKQFPFALYSMRMLELKFQADRARERPDHRGRQRLLPQGGGELTWRSRSSGSATRGCSRSACCTTTGSTTAPRCSTRSPTRRSRRSGC